MANTFYSELDVLIFPSSNAKDEGKLTSEENLHNILVYGGFKNHVLHESDFMPSISSSGTKITVTKGEADINGYTISIKSDITIDVPETAGNYSLTLSLIKDDSDHVKGDVGGYNEGIIVTCKSASEMLTNDDLLLATLSVDSSGKGKLTLDPSRAYKIKASEVETIDNEDNKVKSAQDVMNLSKTRYVSRLNNDTKINKLEFLDTFTSPSKTISIDPVANEISAKDSNNKVTVSASKLNIVSKSTKVADVSNSGTSIVGTFGIPISLLNSKTTTIGNTNNKAEFTTSDIKLNGTAATFSSSYDTLFNIKVSGNTISNVNASSSIVFGSPISCNSTITANQFVSTSNGFFYNGSNTKTKLADTNTSNSAIRVCDNTSLNCSASNNYSSMDNSQLGFYRASNAKDGTPQIAFYSGSSVKATIYNKYNSNTINVSGNLAVSGTVNANKVYSAVYNDLAELYMRSNTDESVEVGDIIALKEDGNYGKCDTRNCNLVVGVFSDSYGYLLGGDKDSTLSENLRKYIPVGISGRVKVKCVTDDVIPGDLIVSSEYAGYGMVNNFPMPGTVIGKALTANVDGYVTIQIMLA